MDGALRDEATKLLADLIRIDTSNPPGHETPAAVFLQWFLEREGIACELHREGPGARQPRRADQGQRRGPVADAARAHRRRAGRSRVAGASIPFEGVVQDGYVWGRGALDMKCHTVCNVLAFALIARSGIRPRGDLVLIAEADEEEGTTGVGLPVRRRAASRPAHRLRAQRVERAPRARRRPGRAPVRHRREGDDAGAA